MRAIVAFLLLIGICWIGASTTATPPGGYVPGPGPGYSPTDDLLKQLLEEVRQIRLELRVAGMAKENTLTKAVVVKNRCASCHNPEKASGGLVLMDKSGNLAELSLFEQKHVAEAVSTGKMPPPEKGPLSDSEKKLFRKP